jgi:hypothetical protein
MLAPIDEQPALRKKTLMEIFRSERMKTIDKYLGWLSGS